MPSGSWVFRGLAPCTPGWPIQHQTIFLSILQTSAYAFILSQYVQADELKYWGPCNTIWDKSQRPRSQCEGFTKAKS